MEQSLFSRAPAGDVATRRLLIAVVLSVVVHLLIIGLWRLLDAIVPAVPVVAAEAPSTLEFKFAPVDPEAERPVEARGDVPLPQPEPPQPAPPSPQSPPPSPATAPAETAPPLGDEIAEVVERFDEVRDRGESATEAEAPGAPVDLAPEGDFVDGAGGSTLPPPTQGREDGLRIDEAVRDFASAVRRRDRDVIDSLHRQNNNFTFHPPSLPSEGSMFGELEFSTAYPWRDYARQIRTAIMRAWFRRIYRSIGDFEGWASLNQYELEHANRIRFVIEADGDISSIELLGPSGCDPLDLSAMGGLEDVILPALPEDFPHARETVTARFVAEGPIYQRGRRQERGSAGDLHWKNFTDRSLYRYMTAMKQVYGF